LEGVSAVGNVSAIGYLSELSLEVKEFGDGSLSRSNEGKYPGNDKQTGQSSRKYGCFGQSASYRQLLGLNFHSICGFVLLFVAKEGFCL
jgi:hypothetical protein